VAGFRFREKFLLLQLKCDLLVSSQDRKDAAQRLQRLVQWEESFEETFHRRFTVLCPMGFAIDQIISVFSKLVKVICDLN
jgi:hypothetical protein